MKKLCFINIKLFMIKVQNFPSLTKCGVARIFKGERATNLKKTVKTLEISKFLWICPSISPLATRLLIFNDVTKYLLMIMNINYSLYF
jgi:hypothetical protein